MCYETGGMRQGSDNMHQQPAERQFRRACSIGLSCPYLDLAFSLAFPCVIRGMDQTKTLKMLE